MGYPTLIDGYIIELHPTFIYMETSPNPTTTQLATSPTGVLVVRRRDAQMRRARVQDATTGAVHADFEPWHRHVFYSYDMCVKVVLEISHMVLS